MSTPSIHAVRGGFEAMCGKCLRPSAAVAADSPESAWVAMQALGWTLYRDYALCPACTKDPPTSTRMPRGRCEDASGGDPSPTSGTHTIGGGGDAR
jgi:hypothetical protein